MSAERRSDKAQDAQRHRQGTHGGRKSSLLTAKCKISPLRLVTIPRLELCAALLGTRLLNSVNAALAKTEVNVGDCYAWSDSTIVLCYLSKQPRLLTTFVANRVAEIQEFDGTKWHHVLSEDSPADVASTGISPACYVGSLYGGRGPPGYPKETSQHHPSFQRRQKS